MTASHFETTVKIWMVTRLDEAIVWREKLATTLGEEIPDKDSYPDYLTRATINHFDLYGCEPAQEDVGVWAAEIVKEHITNACWKGTDHAQL